MAEYVNIRVRKDTYERLKELSAGVPLVRFLDDACRHWSQNGKDEADTLLEQLDKQAEEEAAAANALFASLDNDELPECCQGIYSGRKDDRCEHWIIKNNRWYNQGTNRYIDDPAYVNYFQNA